MKTIQIGTRASVLVLLAALTLSLFALPAHAVTTGTDTGTKATGASSGNSGAPGDSGDNSAPSSSYGGSTAYSDYAKRLSETSSKGKTATETAQLQDLMKRIQDLLEQLRQLREQITGTPRPGTGTTRPPRHSPAVCAALPDLGNFRQGMGGAGVKTIQQFLIAEGVLASDSATGYFGNATAQALKQWQQKRGIVATSTATSTGAGMFGKLTREDMIRRCENRDGDEVGSFRLSPSQGRAPLTVEVSGVPAAVLKKMNECTHTLSRGGMGLTIDWGDGTTSPGPRTTANSGKSCVNEVKKHTYTKPGVYTAKIRSWSPGPTDAPVTDWQGTARVTVTDRVASTTKATTTAPLSTPAALKARTALAEKLDAFTRTITIKQVHKTEWSDGCLGLGGAAESCLAAITPGYRVTMEKGTTTYYARTNSTGSAVRFE